MVSRANLVQMLHKVRSTRLPYLLKLKTASNIDQKYSTLPHIASQLFPSQIRLL